MYQDKENHSLFNQKSIKNLRAQRDTDIVSVFKNTQSIYETRKHFNFQYSRDIVRLAITKAGVYDKTTRLNLEIARSKNKVVKRKYIDRCCSKQFKLEIQFQNAIKAKLNKFQVYYNTEVQIPNSQMRADFIGKNWLIETKVHVDSQSMLTAIAQCIIYSDKLNLKHKALVIPNDIDPTDFFISEYKNFDIEIVKFLDLNLWLVKALNGRN